jgi:hypothetical protein
VYAPKGKKNMYPNALPLIEFNQKLELSDFLIKGIKINNNLK